MSISQNIIVNKVKRRKYLIYEIPVITVIFILNQEFSILIVGHICRSTMFRNIFNRKRNTEITKVWTIHRFLFSHSNYFKQFLFTQLILNTQFRYSNLIFSFVSLSPEIMNNWSWEYGIHLGLPTEVISRNINPFRQFINVGFDYQDCWKIKSA